MKAWVWTRTYKSNLLPETRELCKMSRPGGQSLEEKFIYCETDLILF